MTEIKKLLFIIYHKNQRMALPVLDKLLSLKNLGLEEITILHQLPELILPENKSGGQVKIKEITEKKICSSLILRTVRDNGISLIAFSMDRESRYSSAKSLMRKLIHASNCPILFSIGDEDEPSPESGELFSHAIFATDWSSTSEKALQLLLGFKKILGELEIVNVINRRLTIKDMRDLKEKMAHTRKICLEKEIDAEAHIYAGNTPVEILTAARDYKGTIIIVGGRSKKNIFRKIISGSSTYRVAENAQLPVLVIP